MMSSKRSAKAAGIYIFKALKMYNRIVEIIEFYKNSDTSELSKTADAVTRENHGDSVYLRGLIEFSNHCGCNCLYCGIRAGNRKVRRYRLHDDEVLQAVKRGYKAGIKTFVLQSGEDSAPVKEITGLIEKIKNGTEGTAALTLSCGVMKREDYLALRKAGADRYLLRFETSDAGLYSYLRSGSPLESRLRALYDLKDLDYEVGSGYMTGLPGETEDTRIRNALVCRALELDMAGIGPFIPHPDTPLCGVTRPDIRLTVRAVALVRLLLPRAHIVATTAAGSIDPEGREKILSSGANVLMPNITPLKYRKNYLLYPGKICLDEDGIDCISCLEIRARSRGKSIDMNRGDALRRLKGA